jgi:hypothetical protein
MFDGFWSFVLGNFAVAAAYALVLARAGHFLGARGATFAVLSLWIVLTSVLLFIMREISDPWGAWPIIAILASIPLSAVFIPMMLLKHCSWIRGRLVGGLAGAAYWAIVVWTITPRVIARACTTGIDCI